MELVRVYMRFWGFPLSFLGFLLPNFRLIAHIRHVVNGDECLRVFPIDEVHQLLILALVDDGDDLVVLFKVIRADGLVDRRAAVQILNDELAERFFLLRDDTDAALFYCGRR